MLPMDHVVRKQAQDINRTLQSQGLGRNEIGLALAQSIGTLLLPLQGSNSRADSDLMDAIRSHAALHLSRRAAAAAILGRKPRQLAAMPGFDEDQVADAFAGFQCLIERLSAQETEDDLLDYGALSEILIDMLIELELEWLSLPRLSAIVVRSRATDESIADGDEDLFSQDNHRLN